MPAAVPASIPPAAPPAARRGFLVPPASAPAAAAAAADILRLSRSLVVAIVLSAVVVSPSLVIRTLIIDGVFGTTAHVTRVPVPVAAPAAAASAASLAPDVVLLVGSVGRFRGSAADVPVASLVLLLLFLLGIILARREFLSVRVERGILASLAVAAAAALGPAATLGRGLLLRLAFPLLLLLLLRIGG